MSMRKLLQLAFSTVLLSVIAQTALSCPLYTPDCSFDKQRPAWFIGNEVDHFVVLPGMAGGSGPNGPTDAAPDTRIYIIGNINDGNPFAPAEPVPAVDPATGQPIFDENGNLVIAFWIPDHDHVWTEFTWEVVDGFGAFVVPGPNANSSNVRTRPMPAMSLPGAPLAYQIKIGPTWQNLNNHSLIEVGLDMGILDLVDIGWGGQGWFEMNR